MDTLTEDILSSTPSAKRSKVEDIITEGSAKKRGAPAGVSKFPQLESVMQVWLKSYIEENGTLPQLPLIVRQARSFAAEIPVHKFVGTVAWSKSFLKRFDKAFHITNDGKAASRIIVTETSPPVHVESDVTPLTPLTSLKVNFSLKFFVLHFLQWVLQIRKFPPISLKIAKI